MKCVRMWKVSISVELAFLFSFHLLLRENFHKHYRCHNWRNVEKYFNSKQRCWMDLEISRNAQLPIDKKRWCAHNKDAYDDGSDPIQSTANNKIIAIVEDNDLYLYGNAISSKNNMPYKFLHDIFWSISNCINSKSS